MNTLYYGDNLAIMQHRMKKFSVDLIYLDPPFNSNKNYNLMYRTMTGKPVPEQVDAFCDTWELDEEKKKIAQAMPVLLRENGVEDYYVQFWRLWFDALRKSRPELLAYLTYMVQRLLYMKGILKPNGSIYLHCDPTVSHYIKVMMDGIFGHENFRSEIIWKRTSAHNSAKRYGPVHDVILFYSKSDKYTWNPSFQPLPQETADAWYNNVEPDTKRRFNRADLTAPGVRAGPSGKAWRGIDVSAKGRHWAIPGFVGMADAEAPAALDALDKAGRLHWPKRQNGMPMLKRYLDESKGVPLQDVWTDIRPLHNLSAERLGYPTQKPRDLLHRIIEASTKPGQTVFDPFCGCGTTVYAAHEMGREWIGCDIAILAVKLIKDTLLERYRLAEGEHYKVDGIPVSVEQAELLAKREPHTFQSWFVERVGGFPLNKKGADRGIDGRLYFEVRGGLKEMVMSVKGGMIRPTDVRDLRGVLEREREAELAAFLTFREPTKAMQREADDAGFYEYQGFRYPRIQLLTVRDVLEDGRELATPTKVRSRISTGQQTLALPGGTGRRPAAE